VLDTCDADTGGQHAELGFDEVFVDPYTGAILGARMWGVGPPRAKG
jgi:hypothetical protein